MILETQKNDLTSLLMFSLVYKILVCLFFLLLQQYTILYCIVIYVWISTTIIITNNYGVTLTV